MRVIQEEPEQRGTVMDPKHAAQLPALSLAYVGDTVFDLYVRTWLVAHHTGDVGQMHRQAIRLVNAGAQAAYARAILDSLTEDERDIFMRGRNAKPGTVPKHMRVGDYHYATGLEAVIGYLYLSGQKDRIRELLKDLHMQSLSEDENEG